MIKYALHPRHIPSKHDGDYHYISYFKLIQLYKLSPAECVDATGVHYRACIGNKMIHLYPRYHGDYEEHLNSLLSDSIIAP